MSHAALRAQDHYKAVIRELKAAGLKWREEFRGKHASLIIEVNGREETEILSITPSDHRAPVKARARIRRSIKEWMAEGVASLATETPPAKFPTLEKETTVDTTTSGELRVVEFRGSAIDTIEIDGIPRVALKPVVDGIGLDWSAQYRRVMADPVLSEGVVVTAIPSQGGMQEAVTIPLRMLNGFLFGISVSRVKKSAQPAVLAYQRECYDVLADHWLGQERSAGPVVEYGDDTEALLDMLSEIRTAVVQAQQSGHSTALEHIDGSKAAVLHYLKAYLKEPAQAFYADAQARNKAAYLRDKLVLKQMEAVVEAVSDLLDKAQPSLLDRPFILEEWFDAQRIYSEFFADRTIPNQRFLSQSVAKALDGECKRRRRFNDMDQQVIGGKPKNFWHRNIVEMWLETGGKAMVEQHIARFIPKDQKVLPFVRRGS